VNVFRSGNSGIDRIAPDDVGEGERFPLFPLLREEAPRRLGFGGWCPLDRSEEAGSVRSAKPSDSVWRARNIARRLQITEEAYVKQGGGWSAAVAVEIVLACIAVQDGHDESEEEEVPLFEDNDIE